MPDSPIKTSPLKIGSVPFHQAIQAAQQKGVVLPAQYYGILQGAARQNAFSISGITAANQLQWVLDSLAKALLAGESFNKWKKQTLDSGSLNLPRHRLDNVFRTNIQNNYNRGRWERFQEVKESRPYLMYDAINDSRVRPAHLAMDGIIKVQGDSFWAEHGPANGFRCRCRLISLSESQAQRRSGNGKGLSKPVIDDDMRPDKGWEYNPGADLTQGVSKAIDSIPETPIKAALATQLIAGQYIPVSNALRLPKSGQTRKYSIDVLDIIGSVHGDGVLPVIPIKTSKSKVFQGVYSHYPTSGKPVKIALSTSSRNPELTLAHEIGHFLDHQSMYLPGKFGSQNSPLFKKWQEAIDNSQATRNIKEKLSSQKTEYYLRPHEQFARSYAQWIAEKSGNEIMLRQVNDIKSHDSDIYSNSQWAAEDFKPISQAIDEIFNSLGWLK